MESKRRKGFVQVIAGDARVRGGSRSRGGLRTHAIHLIGIQRNECIHELFQDNAGIGPVARDDFGRVRKGVECIANGGAKEICVAISEIGTTNCEPVQNETKW